MNDDADSIFLSFFREIPEGLAKSPPLASSLQSFETCLWLIGLRRYPAALIACGSALESCVKATLATAPNSRIDHHDLQVKLRKQYPSLRAISDEDEREFRNKRNQIVHYGFSPRDDEVCASLLLKTGLPYLSLLYRLLFDFYLDWRDVVSAREEFYGLGKEGARNIGLIPEVADHLRNAVQAYQRVQGNANVEAVYCLVPLSHYLLRSLQYAASSPSEWNALVDSENTWEMAAKLGEKIEAKYGVWARFDCPVCGGGDLLVGKLHEDRMDEGLVEILDCECVECGFRLDAAGAYMTNMLLSDQIKTRATEILRGYGIEARGA